MYGVIPEHDVLEQKHKFGVMPELDVLDWNTERDRGMGEYPKAQKNQRTNENSENRADTKVEAKRKKSRKSPNKSKPPRDWKEKLMFTK